MNAKKEALLLRSLVMAAAGVTLAVLLLIVGYILVMGVPHLNLDLFRLHYTSENLSLFPALVNTLIIIALALLLALPLGLATAIFQVEYAAKGSRLLRLIRLTTETLAGIPSIVYGLFGSIFFVSSLNWQYSLLAGGCTLAIMILPVVIRSAEEALQAVPDAYREASYGLGAGKLYTLVQVVLPSAVPGILAGVILAMGRIVGETAPLIYTAGTVAQLPGSLFSSGRTLAVHLYVLWNEGRNVQAAYATAVVLLALVIGLNLLSRLAARGLSRRKE